MPVRTRRPDIVLASASPRRRQLLGTLGLAFDVTVSEVPEAPLPGEQPQAMVLRLSAAKAEAVVATAADALVIAADTIVVLDGAILGKPADDAEGRDMLVRLRARQHQVYTGLTVIDAAGARRNSQVSVTPVVMRDYGDQEIAAYLASGDHRDKAGAYAIQSPSFSPIAHIDGCYANVMGFPLCHLYRLLRAWGVDVPIHPLAGCPRALSAGCPWAQAILGACDATACCNPINLT
jgi:septum formation protein